MGTKHLDLLYLILIFVHMMGNAASNRLSRRIAIFTACTSLSFPAPSLGSSTIQNPYSANELIVKGMKSFSEGDINKSILLFQEAEAVDNRVSRTLWQKGLSQYYAGDYSGCKRQFLNDVSYNPRDTEEILWAMLCDAKEGGGTSFGKAQEALLPMDLNKDPRSVMRSIYGLFKGTLSEGNFLEIFPPNHEINEKNIGEFFYSRLYLSLLKDAQGTKDLSSKYISEALQSRYAKYSSDYMVKVAKIHSLRLQ